MTWARLISTTIDRHGRIYSGHPRLLGLSMRSQDVDARDRRQVYAVCASLTARPGMTSNY
jgi:hypothetical protein